MKKRNWQPICLITGALMAATGCSIYNAVYQTPVIKRVPATDKEFTVSAGAATTTPLESDRRTAFSTYFSWKMNSDTTLFVSLETDLLLHRAQDNGNSIANAVWIDVYKVLGKARSTAEFIFAIRTGIFGEAGSYVRRYGETPSGTFGAFSGNIMFGGVMSIGMGFALKHPLTYERYFHLLYYFGTVGGLTVAFRVKDIGFYWSTLILGTINSPEYPVIRLGVYYSF